MKKLTNSKGNKFWEKSTRPIYEVLDDDGENMANAQVRQLNSLIDFLYVDDVDGYFLLSQAEVDRLILNHKI